MIACANIAVISQTRDAKHLDKESETHPQVGGSR